MNRRFCALWLLLFILWVWPINVWPGEPDPYLDFAHGLFQEEDYDRAITEARRFIFLNPDHARVPEAWLLVARSYFNLGQFEEAKAGFYKVMAFPGRPELIREAVWDLGRCLEITGPRSEAVNFYRGLIENPPPAIEDPADIRNKARFRLGWLFLEYGNWLESSLVFKAIEEKHPLYRRGERLARMALDGQTLPLKNPSTAGFLSALLPGAGQIYANHPVDAALAFGLNAAFLWGTIEAYNKKSWAVFTLLGIIELSWYGGNIYNAVNGVHIYNRKLKNNFLKKLKREHSLRLGYSPSSRGPFIAWTTRF